MLPFNSSFRRLLFSRIRKIKPEELIEYESLTALRHQLTEERRLSGSLREREQSQKQEEPSIDEALNTLDIQTNEKLAKYKSEIIRLHKVYMTRRKAAFMQRSLFQAPSKDFFKYIGALWILKKEQAKRILKKG